MDSYIGKEVTVNLEEFEPSGVEEYESLIEIDEDGKQEGSVSIMLSYRRYLDRDNDIDGHISSNLLIDVEHGIITDVTPDAHIDVYGDSGVGEGDPDEDWKKSDWDKAYRILNKMTKKAKEKANE